MILYLKYSNGFLGILKQKSKVYRTLHDSVFAYYITLLSFFFFLYSNHSERFKCLAKAKFLTVPGYLNKMSYQKSSF